MTGDKTKQLLALSVRSFECEIKISMTGDKTKQLLRILKWHALVVSGQDNDKMNNGEFGDALARIIVEAFEFRVQVTKDVKSIKKKFKETRYLFLLVFLGPFYLVLLLLNTTPKSQGWEELQQRT